MSSSSSKKPCRPASHDGVVVDQQHLDPCRRLDRDALRPVHRREHSRSGPGSREGRPGRRQWREVASPPGSRRGAHDLGVALADRRVAPSRPLAPRRPEADRGERDADLAEHLHRDEEPGEQEQHAQELAQLVEVRRAGPVERVGEGREERADRDQQRRRHPRVESPRHQLAQRAGQRRDEVDGDRDDRDAQVEHELLARLAGVERVAEHALLGHEHVGREQGAQQQRPAARDVRERRQQPDVAGHRLAGGLAGHRADRVAGGGQGRGRHDQHQRQQRHHDHRAAREPGPARVDEVRLDADRERQDDPAEQVQDRQHPRALVVRASCG